MLNLDIGLSALQASQVALRTASHNLSNASTPGFHRQRVQLADRAPVSDGGLSLGTGVTVAQIRRRIDTAVEAGLLANGSQLAEATVRQATATRLDALLAAREGSLTGTVTQLFDALEQLAPRPREPVLLRQVVSAGQAVTRELNHTLAELDRQQGDLRAQAELGTREVARLSSAIAQLNDRIAVQRSLGNEPNDLLDQRDALHSQLAEWIDIAPAARTSDSDALPAAGGSLAIGRSPVELRIQSSSGELRLVNASGAEIRPQSGRLGGLLIAHNELVGGLRRDLLEWFDGLRGAFDAVQASSLGTDGGWSRLTALRSVSDTDAPLATLAHELPLNSGELFVTLTDVASGQRTTHRIGFDPAVDSLRDVTARLDALPGLSATLSSPDNRLQLVSDAGTRFDFAGRLDPDPQPVAVSGTVVPQVAGLYSGTANARWELEALDAGRVGVDAPLRVQVREVPGGAVLATLDVGLGYAAGTELALPDGVTLRLNAGSLVAGDRWELTLVARPDTTGLVAGLELQSFFTGTGRGPFGVHPDLVSQPQRLAVSRTGAPTDASQLDRLLSIRRDRLYAGDDTIEDRLTTIVSLAGLSQQTIASEMHQLQSQADDLAAQRDAVSGVDPNEEVLSVLQAQRAFQSAARVLSVMQETLADLLELIR